LRAKLEAFKKLLGIIEITARAPKRFAEKINQLEDLASLANSV
jgi:hypothetical protein